MDCGCRGIQDGPDLSKGPRPSNKRSWRVRVPAVCAGSPYNGRSPARHRAPCALQCWNLPSDGIPLPETQRGRRTCGHRRSLPAVRLHHAARNASAPHGPDDTAQGCGGDDQPSGSGAGGGTPAGQYRRRHVRTPVRRNPAPHRQPEGAGNHQLGHSRQGRLGHTPPGLGTGRQLDRDQVAGRPYRCMGSGGPGQYRVHRGQPAPGRVGPPRSVLAQGSHLQRSRAPSTGLPTSRRSPMPRRRRWHKPPADSCL